jgi:hypothetical protein
LLRFDPAAEQFATFELPSANRDVRSSARRRNTAGAGTLYSAASGSQDRWLVKERALPARRRHEAADHGAARSRPQRDVALEAADEQLAWRPERAGPADISQPQLRALQRAAGNRAVSRLAGAANPSGRPLLQRRIDPAKVDANAKFLGVSGKVQAVEVPNAPAFKSNTPFSKYPADKTLNLDALAKTSMLELQFPAQINDPNYTAMSSADIVDMMGGGAYHSGKDLVVLGEGFKDDALTHEMGHKAQNEAGMNADTAVVIVLEYHNFLINENAAWVLGKSNAKPRLSYATGAIPRPKGGAKSFEDLKAAVKARWHHEKPETSDMLESIETTLDGGRYASESDKKGTYAAQARANLVAEYFNTFP